MQLAVLTADSSASRFHRARHIRVGSAIRLRALTVMGPAIIQHRAQLFQTERGLFCCRE